MEALRGDVLTKERMQRKDVRIQESDRGGVSFYIPSYMDHLVDLEIITMSQRSCGMTYWGLRESAFRFMNSDNPIYRDASGVDEEAEPIPDTSCDDNDAMGLFLTLVRSLNARHRKAIDVSCGAIEGSKEAIIWAFGEHALRWAFEELEKKLPEARESYERKIKEMQNSTCEVA